MASICARITGTGSFLPGAPISNTELIARHQLDSSDDWIASRVGIRVRHFAAPGQNSSDLAVEAGRRALESARRAPQDVDLVVVATSTPDCVFPGVATLLQAKLGVNGGGAAFDVQAVCAGFVYALAVAEKFIRSGSHKCALVVGAEVFSRILDWNDRSTCVLFGDGAGALVVEASNEPGILSSALHADGRHRSLLSAPGQICSGSVIGDPFIRMDGQGVFKLAVGLLAAVGSEVMETAGLLPSQVDWLVPHQANARILQAAAKKIDVPAERCVDTIASHGNTSAASIPLALDTAIRDGRVRRGQHVLLAGVGAGFAWGAIVLTL